MNQTYTVKQGDTLYGISNQFGVNVNELAELNNVKANTLQVGQVLLIPIKSGTNPSNMFIYTVKKGDSLYAIAQKYKTTVSAIQNLNNLKTINLSIGQTLRIPEIYSEEEISLPNYINYVVQKGDTLYSIAKNNNIDVPTLMKDNALINTALNVGQVLRIRSLSVPKIEAVAECFGPDYTPVEESKTTIYIVKSGDNLYKIARQFNTTINSIKSKNNLNSNLLSIGQKLII